MRGVTASRRPPTCARPLTATLHSAGNARARDMPQLCQATIERMAARRAVPQAGGVLGIALSGRVQSPL